MRLLVTDAAAQPPRQATAWLIMTFGKMKSQTESKISGVNIAGCILIIGGGLIMRKYQSAMYLMTLGSGLMIYSHTKLDYITFRGHIFKRIEDPVIFYMMNGILAVIGLLPVIAAILD